MDRAVKEDINKALWELGVETPRDDVALRSQMAYGMFDTRGKCAPCASSFWMHNPFSINTHCRRYLCCSGDAVLSTLTMADAEYYVSCARQHLQGFGIKPCGVNYRPQTWLLSCRVDPFAEDSPIKQLEISHFPPDMFFVLRTVQLLRGLAKGMGVDEFSSASQWCVQHTCTWQECSSNTTEALYVLRSDVLETVNANTPSGAA